MSLSFHLEKISRIKILDLMSWLKYIYFIPFFLLASEKLQFLEAFPYQDTEPRKKSRTASRSDVHPDTVKTAVYIKHLFMVGKLTWINIKRFTWVQVN